MSGNCRFSGQLPDSMISAPEFSRDPATSRSRQAGQQAVAFA
jgi:hypothetical protein